MRKRPVTGRKHTLQATHKTCALVWLSHYKACGFGKLFEISGFEWFGFVRVGLVLEFSHVPHHYGCWAPAWLSSIFWSPVDGRRCAPRQVRFRHGRVLISQGGCSCDSLHTGTSRPPGSTQPTCKHGQQRAMAGALRRRNDFKARLSTGDQSAVLSRVFADEWMLFFHCF